MSCRSVFTGLCATSLQCPARKTSPSALTTPCLSGHSLFPFAGVTPRMRLECHFSALKPLSVPLYPSAPLGETNYPMVLSLNLAHHYR